MARRSIAAAGTGAAEPYWISASKIATALACPLKAQRKYKLKLPEKPSLSATRGTWWHKAAERWHGTSAPPGQLPDLLGMVWTVEAVGLREWGELFKNWFAIRQEMAGPLAELDQLAVDIKRDADAGRRSGGSKAPRMTGTYKRAEESLLAPWRDTIESIYAAERALLDSDQSPWQPTHKSAIGEYQTSLDAVQAYEAWWQDLGKRGEQPEFLATEARFEVDLAGFHLVGVIDVVALHPTTGEVMVIDWKTGHRYEERERFLQAAAYAIGAEQIAGDRPATVQFCNVELGPDVDTYRTYPTWDLKLVQMAGWARDAIEGPPVASLHGCHVCSWQRECFDVDAGLFQFTRLEDADDPAAEEVASTP